MDHKGLELLACDCGVLSGWWLWGWFWYTHPDTGCCAHSVRVLCENAPWFQGFWAERGMHPLCVGPVGISFHVCVCNHVHIGKCELPTASDTVVREGMVCLLLGPCVWMRDMGPFPGEMVKKVHMVARCVHVLPSPICVPPILKVKGQFLMI